LKLRVYVPELNGEEAWQLAQKEGINHLVKDSDRFGHIWLEGFNGPMALTYFEPDRDVDSPYTWHRWEKEAKGWIGLAARGWRLKDESLARVTLLYVGEEAIRQTHAKERRKLLQEEGLWHIWPYGVPKRTETKARSEPGFSTVTMLETLKTVEERFKALNKRSNYDGWNECEEFQSWGVKGLVSHDHTVALMPKAVLPAFNDAMAKTGAAYEAMTLADLTRIPDPHGGKEEFYTRTGSKVAFHCEYVDEGLRAWYPRFLKAKYAPTIKVRYPTKQAPAVFYTEDQDCLLMVAPYVIE